MLETYDDILLVDEACEILHMSRNSLYALLHTGALKGFQQGRIWKIPKTALESYIIQSAGL